MGASSRPGHDSNFSGAYGVLHEDAGAAAGGSTYGGAGGDDGSGQDGMAIDPSYFDEDCFMQDADAGGRVPLAGQHAKQRPVALCWLLPQRASKGAWVHMHVHAKPYHRDARP